MQNIYSEIVKELKKKGKLVLGTLIGLDINSDTPEEIAVSIVAQLIKVRGTG